MKMYIYQSNSPRPQSLGEPLRRQRDSGNMKGCVFHIPSSKAIRYAFMSRSAVPLPLRSLCSQLLLTTCFTQWLSSTHENTPIRLYFDHIGVFYYSRSISSISSATASAPLTLPCFISKSALFIALFISLIAPVACILLISPYFAL